MFAFRPSSTSSLKPKQVADFDEIYDFCSRLVQKRRHGYHLNSQPSSEPSVLEGPGQKSDVDAIPKGVDIHSLSGLFIVFTGELDGFTREEIVELVKRFGGRVEKRPSNKTHYAVVGLGVSRNKSEQIAKRKIKILDQHGLLKLIATRKRASGDLVRYEENLSDGAERTNGKEMAQETKSFSVKAESTSSDTEAAAFKHFGTPTGRLPNRRIYRVGYLPGVEYVAIHNQCSIFGWSLSEGIDSELDVLVYRSLPISGPDFHAATLNMTCLDEASFVTFAERYGQVFGANASSKISRLILSRARDLIETKFVESLPQATDVRLELICIGTLAVKMRRKYQQRNLQTPWASSYFSPVRSNETTEPFVPVLVKSRCRRQQFLGGTFSNRLSSESDHLHIKIIEKNPHGYLYRTVARTDARTKAILLPAVQASFLWLFGYVQRVPSSSHMAKSVQLLVFTRRRDAAAFNRHLTHCGLTLDAVPSHYPQNFPVSEVPPAVDEVGQRLLDHARQLERDRLLSLATDSWVRFGAETLEDEEDTAVKIDLAQAIRMLPNPQSSTIASPKGGHGPRSSADRNFENAGERADCASNHDQSSVLNNQSTQPQNPISSCGGPVSVGDQPSDAVPPITPFKHVISSSIPSTFPSSHTRATACSSFNQATQDEPNKVIDAREANIQSRSPVHRNVGVQTEHCDASPQVAQSALHTRARAADIQESTFRSMLDKAGDDITFWINQAITAREELGSLKRKHIEVGQNEERLKQMEQLRGKIARLRGAKDKSRG